ncbi:molybdopterin-binding protein [Oceaniglobus roseus]|uniref:molybdopterin-binding protein n=1 Tax=Oceaniglobus roseus TaxID=1737570 RepID=UPI000C7E8D5F|nr:molybdopterin-binding protein [Kandeliimicrobium roseum]
MEFGTTPLAEAGGAILAHSVMAGKKRLRKGLILEEGHLAALAEAGVAEVTVARLGPGDVHEDEAARRLAAAVLSESSGLRASEASTGRVNLYTEGRGVVQVDRAAVDAVNRIDPAITLATVPELHHMGEGGMAATIKIIAYGVSGEALERAEAAARGALRLAPVKLRDAVLIQTSLTGDGGEKGRKAIAARMETLGLDLVADVVVAHEEGAITAALREAKGDLVLILTASATSDIRDVAPSAVRAAGGHVQHYGMPVDPGNLLFTGDLDGRPVIGLPGCARSPALNGADWVLERVASGIAVTPEDIMGLGVGGLLKEIPTRPRPREGKGRSREAAGSDGT